jgi:hypothetical protein
VDELVRSIVTIVDRFEHGGPQYPLAAEAQERVDLAELSTVADISSIRSLPSTVPTILSDATTLVSAAAPTESRAPRHAQHAPADALIRLDIPRKEDLVELRQWRLVIHRIKHMPS